MKNIFDELYNRARKLKNNCFLFKSPQSRLQMIIDFSDYRKPTPLCNLPPGYTEVRYEAGMENDWLALLNRDEEFGFWEKEQLLDQIINYLVPNGGILIKFDNAIIACASICRFEEFLPSCVLMYVIVNMQHRGRNIGKYVTEKAIETAIDLNYPSVILRTDDFRLPALHIYYELGFKFDESEKKYSKKRWKKIEKTIIQ